MTYAMRMVVALLSLALALVPPTARAEGPVDLLLVLAADVSRSVTEAKFRLQREGAAAAISHPDVVKAITSGPNRRIAVCFVEWATTGMQNVVVDWTLVEDDASAHSFGDRLVEAPRSFVGSTSISSAIDFSINGLVILTPLSETFRPEHTHPEGGLEKYFQDNVIGGFGSFTVVAEGHESFGRALTKKLIAEIAGLPHPQVAAEHSGSSDEPQGYATDN